MGGTGAGYFAVREAAAAARREEARWRRRRAERLGKRADRAADRAASGAPDAEDRVAFDCSALCLGCGYLADTGASSCPACEGDELADLQSNAVFRTLWDWDNAERKRVGTPITAAALVGGLTIGLVLAVVGLTLVDGYDTRPLFAFPATVVAAICGGIGGVLSTRLFPTLSASVRELGEAEPPRRWRLPVPSALDDSVSLEGVLELAGPRVQAPLGIGPCAAWRLQVFFDVGGDAVPERCVLDEGASSAVRVGGESLGADTWVLDEESERRRSFELSFVEHEVFLRARGYDASDGEFRAVVHVVHDGDDVSLEAGQAVGLTSGRVTASGDWVPVAAERSGADSVPQASEQEEAVEA